METVIEELKNPSLIPNGTADNRMVMYVYADAITKCDCGNDLVLTQRVFGNSKYDGSCSCGLGWELLNGKLKTTKK